MAAADVHPVWMSRAATIVSMQQLEDDYVKRAVDAAAIAQPLQCVARPEAPVAEAVGACLPRYSFPALECKIHPPQKRVRSFGDLHNALVPNIEEGSDGWCAPLMLLNQQGCLCNKPSVCICIFTRCPSKCTQCLHLQSAANQPHCNNDRSIACGAGWIR
jgi:hypothetical protein